MPASQKSTRKIPLKNININFRVNSIFGKNRQSFLETSLKIIWAVLHHFLQKLQFSGSIFIIKILIINWLNVTI